MKPLVTKEEFVKGTGAREIKAPPRPRSRTLAEDDLDYFKLMLFGPVGAGKTHLIGQFVRDLGMRVVILSTDIGESGHLTIKTALTQAGKSELADRVRLLNLNGWKEVSDFLQNPYKFAPELWENEPDILAWDGFSGFQQVDISEYVGDMQPAEKTTRDRGDAIDSGLQFEQAQWGMVRNATVRKIDSFLTIRNPSGKPLHKIVTCNEAIAYKPVDASKPTGPQQIVESYKPLLQGAGGAIIQQGFDMILRNTVKIRKADTGAKREYLLITEGSENLVAKSRGFNLDPVMPSSAVLLWEKIQEALGKKIHGSSDS